MIANMVGFADAAGYVAIAAVLADGSGQILLDVNEDLQFRASVVSDVASIPRGRSDEASVREQAEAYLTVGGATSVAVFDPCRTDDQDDDDQDEALVCWDDDERLALIEENVDLNSITELIIENSRGSVVLVHDREGTHCVRESRNVPGFTPQRGDTDALVDAWLDILGGCEHNEVHTIQDDDGWLYMTTLRPMSVQ
jgi:hypothetical protein